MDDIPFLVVSVISLLLLLLIRYIVVVVVVMVMFVLVVNAAACFIFTFVCALRANERNSTQNDDSLIRASSCICEYCKLQAAYLIALCLAVEFNTCNT